MKKSKILIFVEEFWKLTEKSDSETKQTNSDMYEHETRSVCDFVVLTVVPDVVIAHVVSFDNTDNDDDDDNDDDAGDVDFG